jgi:hypothetical protein
MAGMLQRRRRLAWTVWIRVSVLGAVGGALVAWRIRGLILGGPASTQDLLRDLGTVVDALLFSGVQWLLLRRYRLEVHWWVPATVSAAIVNAILIVPSTLNLFIDPTATGPVGASSAVIAGAAALATAGLVVGTAQTLVLRHSGGNAAWLWIPATILGGALAGAFTTALSSQLYGLPAVGTISVVAAAAALFTASTQAPVLQRLVR